MFYQNEIKELKKEWNILDASQIKRAIERIAALGSSAGCYQETPVLLYVVFAIFFTSKCESKTTEDYKKYISSKLKEILFAENIPSKVRDQLNYYSEMILVESYDRVIPLLLMNLVSNWNIFFCNILVYRILEVIIRCSTPTIDDDEFEKIKELAYVALESAETYAQENDL